jgi:hypothetical protein
MRFPIRAAQQSGRRYAGAVRRDIRIVTALLAVCAGALAALLLGGQSPACLGPLGVTVVQCAAASGIVPTIGIGLPALALSLALALLLVAPVPRRAWRHASVAASVGSVVALLAYLALRPVSLEGLGSSGQWYVVPLPVDFAGVATAAIVGAAVGGVVVGGLVSRSVRAA